MKSSGQLSLRDRTFKVKRATIRNGTTGWHVEIDTQAEEYDGENWSPSLYHQGLALSASSIEELQGQATSWGSSRDPAYPHPEIGAMYVFGHHEVRDCTLKFAVHESGGIYIHWEGTCDVYWEGEFSEDVPFVCTCYATAA